MFALASCGGGGGGSAAPTLQSIQITPSAPTLAAGTSLQLQATALYSDGTRSDVTQQATWTCAATATATINGGRVIGVHAGSATVSAAALGASSSVTLSVTAPTLVALQVSPATANIPAGTTQPFQVTGTFTDQSNQNLSADVTWLSSVTATATIATNGLATAVAAGTTTTTASCVVPTACGSLSASASLSVTPAVLVSLSLTPATSSLVAGQAIQITATGVYTDQSTQDLSSQATWVSSGSAATVSGSGLASAIRPGNAAITATLGSQRATANLNVASGTWPVASYEAESGQLAGSAIIVGAADQSDRVVGDLGGEASGRQAVVLTASGDALSWSVKPAEAGANALVVRFSTPDAPGGGGLSGRLTLTIKDSSGATRSQQPLQLDSRYSWLYGGVMDGTKLYNVPANASQYGTASTATHLYDEIQLKLSFPLQAGDMIKLTKDAAAGVASIAVDFIELETLPPALSQPAGFIALTDVRCGALPADLRQTGTVFDGADDSSYGSVFNSVLGKNPHNPTSFAILEKDFYSTNPATDALQDTAANAATGGLSLFDLADHNFRSLQTCLGLATASGGTLTGVYVPPGRFYVRGLLLLPGNVTLQGAGMWYTKFAAVDTAPPVASTYNGVTGIASVSGNLVISSQAGGAASVTVSNLALFGNVTQRDTADSVTPDGLRAQFTNGVVDNVWVEHTFSGLKAFMNSTGVRFSNSRVRNTFADGIDFYGSTSNSSITNSSARSTGDDGFALWSQGSTLTTVSQSNSIQNSTASLQWYGNGFAVYGGNGMSITNSRAADVLNYPCLQMSTQFVPAALPASASMSASATGADFFRCGGNGFNQQFGAVLIGTDLENISSLSISQLNIASPTFKAIDIRSIPQPASHTVVATMNGVSVQNAQALGAPACAVVGPYTGGMVQLNNVCTCAQAGSTPAICPASISGSSTLQVIPNTCTAAMCASF